jgi:hypothetical protein
MIMTLESQYLVGLSLQDEDDFDQDKPIDSIRDAPKALTTQEPQFAQNKQIPTGKNTLRDQPILPTSKQPNFGVLKNAKPTGIKDGEDKGAAKISYTGGLKPNMSLDARNFRAGSRDVPHPPPKSYQTKPILASNRGDGRSSYHLSGQLRSSEPYFSSLDGIDTRPKHEIVIEHAKDYIEDDKKRTLEGLFDFHAKGSKILKEINELLSNFIDKHKHKLVNGGSITGSTAATTDRYSQDPAKDKEKQLSVYNKEFQTGEKFLQNLSMELQEVEKTLANVKTPL